MIRVALIEELVTTLHLSVPEREIFGPKPLQESETIAIVTRILCDAGYFPVHARPWHDLEVVFEGHFLQLLPDRHVAIWCQRHNPLNPRSLAEYKRVVISDIIRAVKEFIRLEWGEGIDGVPLAEDASQ